MPQASASWWLDEREEKRIDSLLGDFLHDSNSRCVLLIDRLGQVLTTLGDTPDFDAAAFASLAAADFSANAQLASMIGEDEFTSLFHQGTRDSLYLADIAKRVILVVLFDDRATLGMIRIKVRKLVGDLSGVISKSDKEMAASAGDSPFKGAWATAAETEIDRLFGTL